MLTYHPIFDSNHCLFRILCLLNRLSRSPQEVDKIRLFDFYLGAPYALKLFRTNSQAVRNQKNQILKELSQYDEIDNSKALFFDSKSIQLTVFSYLAAKNIISVEEYNKNIVVVNDHEFTSIADSVLNQQKSIISPVMNLIENELQNIPVLGNDGLKHRSNLMEYRYDIL